MLRAALAGARLQLRMLPRTPPFHMVLVTVPSYTIIFLALTRDAGRDDLVGSAVIAPVLIALWGVAIWVSGSIVRGDRWLGVLEPTIAAPASYAAVLLGRILIVTAASLVAVAEVWLTARLLFGITIALPHPGAFAATLAATVAAMAGTAVVMSALFVLSRVANTFQSSASWPFYVLGGVLVPVALLPGWVRPLSWLVFLSWSADLLRDTLSPEPLRALTGRLAVILLLAAAGFAGGTWLLGRVLHRVRGTGELALR